MTRAAALLVVGLSAACVSATGSGSSALVVRGTWDYSATQTAPTPASLTGTLTITSQAAINFQGSISVTETDGSGSTTLSGVVNGQTVNDTTVDFDVFVDPNARRHIAVVVRDSMRGGWFESNADGSTTTGTFVAVLRSVP